MKGWSSQSILLETLATPEGRRWDVNPDGKISILDNKPTWTRIDLFMEGVLPETVYEEIDGRIDQECRRQDADRRAKRNLSKRTRASERSRSTD